MASPLSLKCPNCGSSLRTEDLNLSSGVATCSYCRAVMTLGNSGNSGESHRRPPVPMPQGLNRVNEGADVIFTRRWFTPVTIFLAFFCVAWDGFLVFWYTMAFTQKNVPWIMVVFPIVHLAVGVGLTYFCIASFLNRTTIRIGSGMLSMHHGPVPWWGNVKLSRGDIDQLFCKAVINRGKNGTTTSYEVHYLTREGSSRKLLSGVMLTDQVALYLEQEIERVFGIADRKVSGEMAR